MTSPPPSKLFIRSEVLAVVQKLTTLEDLSKQERTKQVKRLAAIEDRQAVADILIKELARTKAPENIQVVSELLMELADIEMVQSALWKLIESNMTSDEVKDASNLILRQLGDDTDPNKYLDYLDDPEALINRETERMLEVSTRNPEALIDFIDFIYSLPVGEQINLLASLEEDYPVNYLVGIYIPFMMSDPPEETAEAMFPMLGKTKHPDVARFLEQFEYVYKEHPVLGKPYKKAVSELRLAGVFDAAEDNKKHSLTDEAKVHDCFVTLPDGMGNQGLIISRKWENGDIAMMSVAINDHQGIIDCFGFFQLSQTDFQRICEKFHEESSKVKVSAEYCVYKLQEAEKMNHKHFNRFPYEYICWKVMLDDLAPADINLMQIAAEKAKPEWHAQTGNLYDHPDFSTWFLEDGDNKDVNECLADVLKQVSAIDAETEKEPWLDSMEKATDKLVQALIKSPWLETMSFRLADTAYLLADQKADTLSVLAATEAIFLKALEDKDLDIEPQGFLNVYGNRCIEEFLLRLDFNEGLTKQQRNLVEALHEKWDRG